MKRTPHPDSAIWRCHECVELQHQRTRPPPQTESRIFCYSSARPCSQPVWQGRM